MPKTYNEIYLEARKKLRENGISAHSLEARLIVAYAANKSTDALMRELNLYTSDEVVRRVSELVERRLGGEPVAYITGDWEFYGMPMLVTRDVLIPRMDTEVIVETAVSALKGRKMDARVLDLCAGSGCIGCAIARELPATHVVLADNSRAALSVARQNVLKNRLNPRVTCVETDALATPPLMLGSFDLLTCNPPYIPTEELGKLDSSVKDYEPMAALDGGADGLDFYRAVVKKWHNVVRIGGMVIFEVGIGQAAEVAGMMKSSGMSNIGFAKDTLNIDRAVYGNI